MIFVTEGPLVKHVTSASSPEQREEPIKIYSEYDAGSVLGVSARLIRWWIKNGEIRAFNVARSATSSNPEWRIASDELHRFIASRLNPPASKSA